MAQDSSVLYWMTKYQNTIRHKKFYEITMPGSHDSMTFGNCPLFPKASTQKLTIHESLCCGVRYFDIRVKKTSQRKNGNIQQLYHGVHGIISCTPTLYSLLTDINTFYKKLGAAGELCFLKFRFPKCLKEQHSQAVRTIFTHLKDKILPKEAWNKTYEEIRKTYPKQSLFLCFCDELASIQPTFLLNNDEYVWDPYDQKDDYTDPKKLQKHLRQIYSCQKPTNSYCLTVVQWIATGYFWKFWKVFFTSFSIPTLADTTLNKYMIEKSNQNMFSSQQRLKPPQKRQYHNVIMLDGIECKKDIGKGVIHFIISQNSNSSFTSRRLSL